MGYVHDSKMLMYYGGRGGSVGSNSRVGERKVEFMGRIGGGSFAKRSMVARDGLGGDGFVVDGGRSSSKSRKDEEDGGVENKSSMGSRLIATGEVVVMVVAEGFMMILLVGETRYDEISNLVDLYMGMFGGWKWQDIQGLLWLDHHKKKMCVKGVSNGEIWLAIYRQKIHCSPVLPVLLKKGTDSQKQGHRPTFAHVAHSENKPPSVKELWLFLGFSLPLHELDLIRSIHEDNGISLSGCQANETSADMNPYGDGGKAYGAFSNAVQIVGVVDSPDRAALTESWKSWLEEHIEATRKSPSWQ
ncbi:hypothetical protein Tco_0414893 [Tanacetum coccineum]